MSRSLPHIIRNTDSILTTDNFMNNINNKNCRHLVINTDIKLTFNGEQNASILIDANSALLVIFPAISS